jgi:hypothetical protein
VPFSGPISRDSDENDLPSFVGVEMTVVRRSRRF